MSDANAERNSLVVGEGECDGFECGTTNRDELTLKSCFLKNVLLDLGLTETAHKLEEEMQRIMGRISETNGSNGIANDSAQLSTGHVNDISKNNDGPDTANGVCGNATGCPQDAPKPCSKDFSEGDLLDKCRDVFDRFVSHNREDVDKSQVEEIISNLCQLAIRPAKYANCEATARAGNEEPTSLSVQVRNLLNMFLGGDVCGPHREGHVVSVAPQAWTPLIEVFTSYVDALWMQICLAEAVSTADFSECGWNRNRHEILLNLSHLQEKVQRLLVEVRQLQSERRAVEGHKSGDDTKKNNDAPACCRLRSCIPPKVPASPEDHEVDTGADIGKLYNGVFAFFSHREPTFRQNVEDVSSWIMDQCTRYALKGTVINLPTNGRTDHIEGVENRAESPSAKDTSEAFSLKKAWQQVTERLRLVVVAKSGNVPEHKHTVVQLSVPEVISLCYAQASVRIQFLAWVIGSLAEIREVISSQRTSQVGRKNSTLSNELTSSTIVAMVVGFWYQQCAVQLERETNTENKDSTQASINRVMSCSYVVAGRTYPGPSGDVSRCHNTKHLSDGRSRCAALLANALTRVACDCVRVSQTASSWRHLMLARTDVWSSAFNNSFVDSCSSEVDQPLSGRYGASDVHMHILTALATGRPHSTMRVDVAQRTSTRCVIKRVLGLNRLLLNLQDPEFSLDMQLQAIASSTGCPPALTTGGFSNVRREPTARACTQAHHPTGVRSETAAEHSNDNGALASMESMPVEVVQLAEHLLYGPSNTPTGSLMTDFSSVEARQQLAMDLRASAGNTFGIVDDATPSTEAYTSNVDETHIDSADTVSHPSESGAPNEVQLITLTPCGSLLALLTTKGRLVVFATRAALGHCSADSSGVSYRSFDEKVVMSTFISDNGDELQWYALLSSFIIFSPCGRFLLCAFHVGTPPSSNRIKEAERSLHAYKDVGKMRIYSMHCVEDCCSSESGINEDSCGKGDRLYAEYQVHAVPVTAACWLDPRFLGRLRTKNIRQDSDHKLIWKQVAHWHLSVFQCLSCGSDGHIVRWSPADGTVIQRIATHPVRDILYCPLMQAIYTINEYEQLSMYDAWNEQNMDNEEENIVEVSQRGLPASLSQPQPPADLDVEAPTNTSTTRVMPLKDGEVQRDFFAGSRVIRFDRQHVGRGHAGNEPLLSCISRVVCERGAPSGAETRDSERIGRRILREALRCEKADSISNVCVTLDPLDDSDTDEETGKCCRQHRRSLNTCAHMYRESNYISSLRRRHHLHNDGGSFSQTALKGRAALSNDLMHEDIAMYPTGSRLVFSQIPEVLYSMAGISHLQRESQFAAPPEPYHLISMRASGCPVWGEDGSRRLHHRCACCCGNRSGLDPVVPRCHYYANIVAECDKCWGGEARVSFVNGDTAAAHGSGSLLTGQRCKESEVSGVCKSRARIDHKTLKPSAENGRYLCIVASVGPTRSQTQAEHSLQFRPGMYACVVFDVFYSNVVRVIPVCPTLPHTPLTGNGVDPPNPDVKCAPIYNLPCSVTVVRRLERKLRHDVRRQSESHNTSGTTWYRYGVDTASPHLCTHQVENENDDECNSPLVLLVVGGLHSITYVFDALTGSRIKVLKLRRENRTGEGTPAVEEHPPSKRTRFSYLSLAEFEQTEESLSADDAAGSENEDDSGSDSVFGSLLSQRDTDDGIDRRQALLLGLADVHGVSTVLHATVEMLSVVPQPVISFWSGQNRIEMEDLGNSSTARSDSISRLADAIGTVVGTATSPSNLLLEPHCSFIEQLQHAVESVHKSHGSTLQKRRRDTDAKDLTAASRHDVLFEHFSYAKWRQAALGKPSDTHSATPIVFPSSHFRCGVVNSVELWWDELKNAVYIFSSDEYGSLFLSGGLLGQVA
ncbi:hypothetical protein TRVL_01916 [Trypanosoma vivax]|nr:hypothetical protein TRVL_01916 [Trypanosoma vivax]